MVRLDFDTWQSCEQDPIPEAGAGLAQTRSAPPQANLGFSSTRFSAH